MLAVYHAESSARALTYNIVLRVGDKSNIN